MQGLLFYTNWNRPLIYLQYYTEYFAFFEVIMFRLQACDYSYYTRSERCISKRVKQL